MTSGLPPTSKAAAVMVFNRILSVGIATGIASASIDASLARPSRDPGYSCTCSHDINHSRKFCYGYALTIGPRRLELYEGETGGSGRHSMRKTRSGDLYAATIRTQTGQRMKVFAMRRPDGETTVYTGRMRPGAYDFVAYCR